MKANLSKFLEIVNIAVIIASTFKMCNCDNRTTIDLKTPRNVHLTAFYKRSFAYHTVRNRMPVIVTQVIDSLSRNKDEIIRSYGQGAQEEIKQVISEISQLKYEIQTNKPLKNLTSDSSDVKFYNEYLASQATEDGEPKYFTAIWLLSECYMYRKLREVFELTTTLRDFDPFRKQKEESFQSAIPLMLELGKFILKEINATSTQANKTEFITLLKLNLWGNKCDLSLSNGVVSSENENLTNITGLDPFILSDNSEAIWGVISDEDETSKIVDIILDNAGYEVFSDMCLADYIISKNLAEEVRIYVKVIPWFVSDTMTHDFHWIIHSLKNNSDTVLKTLGGRWSNYLTEGKWTLYESDFWTLPVDFSYMSRVNPDLYKRLSEAKLALFKGDLNYRKLFGEKNWDPTTPLEEALQGFNPTKIATLRTIKSEIVCGLKEGVAQKAESEDEKWMETGNYGLIQYCGVVKKLKSEQEES